MDKVGGEEGEGEMYGENNIDIYNTRKRLSDTENKLWLPKREGRKVN